MSSSVTSAAANEEVRAALANAEVEARNNDQEEAMVVARVGNLAVSDEPYNFNFEADEMEITAQDIELLSHGTQILSIPKFLGFMRYERLRLASFLGIGRAWPLMKVISPVALAKNGFYYLSGDFVQCAFCLVILSDWEKGDIIEVEHKYHSPQCPLLLGKAKGNVTLENDPEVQNYAPTPRYKPVSSETTYSQSPVACDGQYASLEARIESFNRPNWNCKVAFRDLAEAGFFYLEHLTQGDQSEVPDRTRCFHCGGTLCHWVEEDNPLEEHFKFFPKCAFLATIMPPDFVEFVLKKEDMILKRLEFDDSRIEAIHDISRMRRFRYEDYQRMKRIAEITARDFYLSDDDDEGEKGRKEATSSPSASGSALSSAAGAAAAAVNGLKAFPSLVLNYLSKFSFFSEACELSRYAENSTWHNNVSQPRNDLGGGKRRTKAGKEAQQSFLVHVPGPNDADSGTSSDPENNGQVSPTSEESDFSLDKPAAGAERDESGNGEVIAPVAMPTADNDPSKPTIDRLLCTICCERQLNVVFLPCGHQLSCVMCSTLIENCPVCRTKINTKVRTFLCN